MTKKEAVLEEIIRCIWSKGRENYSLVSDDYSTLKKEICHLFLKTPDNPDGREPQKKGKGKRYGLPPNASQRRM